MVKRVISARPAQKKNKAKPKAKAVRVNVARPKPAAKPKPQRVNDAASAYGMALMQPFSPKAIGARVPDMYSFPTTTYRVAKRFPVYTNASGRASCIILPSAFLHAWSPDGSFASSASSGRFVVTNPLELDSKLSQYRIVGWGCKVSVITSALNVAGRYMVAEAPAACYLPDWKFGITPTGKELGVGEVDVNEQDTNSQFLLSLGYPYTSTGGVTGSAASDTATLDSASFTAIPTHRNLSMPELGATDAVIVSKLTSPKAHCFRQSTNRGNGYDVTDSSNLIIAVGQNSTKAGDASYRELHGWSSIAMVMEGMPASQAVAEIELVYHLEGEIPVSTSTSLIAPSSRGVDVNIAGFNRAIEAASKSPWFKLAQSAARLMIA